MTGADDERLVLERSDERKLALYLKATSRFVKRLEVKPTGCLEWIGARNADGYGLIRIGGRDDGWTERAHRLAWVLNNGLIPPGIFVCHTCDNPPCCNPEHLWLGDNAANIRDRNAKGRMPDVKPPPNSFPGSKHIGAKLTEADIPVIRALGQTTKQRDIAALYGVDQALICRILRGRRWRHV